MRRPGVLVLVAVALVGGCGSDADDDGRPDVVASFYPLAEAAARVGGRLVSVANLTPPGAEPHDMELSPDQVVDIEDADVVLVLGKDFQPAVERVAEGRDGTVEVLEGLPGVTGGDRDPHVWLDPVLMAGIVEQVEAALVRADPAHESAYRRNGARFRAELSALDGRYREGLARCDRREVVTAHEAFGRLAARYDLTQEAIAGISPSAEPSPSRLARLADLVRSRRVTTVFTEALVSSKVAETLARDAGVATEVLDPLEGLSRAQLRRGASYVSVMDENLAKLRSALGCR